MPGSGTGVEPSSSCAEVTLMSVVPAPDEAVSRKHVRIHEGQGYAETRIGRDRRRRKDWRHRSVERKVEGVAGAEIAESRRARLRMRRHDNQTIFMMVTALQWRSLPGPA